jgi:hypothetical protein
VVPYGDPMPQQARKNAFDTGEYGVGYCTNSLSLGCDCLGVIKYSPTDGPSTTPTRPPQRAQPRGIDGEYACGALTAVLDAHSSCTRRKML